MTRAYVWIKMRQQSSVGVRNRIQHLDRLFIALRPSVVLLFLQLQRLHRLPAVRLQANQTTRRAGRFLRPPTRCPFCFLDPCFITRPHNFLGPGRAACDDNSALRRTKYKKYWNMLAYMGAWGIQEYVERRRQALAIDPAARGNNPREIMPICVVKPC